MSGTPSQQNNRGVWLLAGASVIIVVGALVSRVERTAPHAVEAGADVESSLITARVTSQEPVAQAQIAAGESNVDRLVRHLRETLTNHDGAATELAGRNEWRQLLKEDASAALRLFAEVSDRDQRARLLPLLVTEWAKVDGANALGWAAQLTDPLERYVALCAGCRGLAESDPKAAVEVADRQFSGEQHDTILPELGRQWANQNLDDAMAWARNRAADESRDKLFLEIALVAAESSPEKGARITAEYIAPGATQTAAALSVLDRWAQSDFAAATAWINQFPASTTRDQGVLHLGRVAFYRTQQPTGAVSPR